jgi:hypothetical protein
VNLLIELPFDGYPSEYLLARLQGRNGERIRDWSALLSRSRPIGPSEESRWRQSRKELAWLFQQMNRTLRRQLNPVFTVFELRTLINCLRHKSSHAHDAIEVLLKDSLLTPKLKRILLRNEEPQTTIAATSAWLANQQQDFAELTDVYAEDGLRGFERELYHRYLRHTLTGHHPVVVQKVLGHLVDLHNLLALYKKLRWELEPPCDFLAGGSIDLPRLKKTEAQGRLPALANLLDRLPGGVGFSAERAETALMRTLTRELRLARRDTNGIWTIVNFAWGQFIQARNLRLLQLCPDLEANALAAELIL